MICSKHFNKRCKERLGLNKRATAMFLSRAIRYGLRKDDIKCNRFLYGYIESLQYDDEWGKTSELIIYNRYIVVIGRRPPNSELVGITILCLPRKYFVVVDNIKNKKGVARHGKSSTKKRNTKGRKPRLEDYSYSR